jgi:5-methylcytosine-specific restriction endonuclease McrA
MGNKYINKPSHPGYNSAIESECDFCGIVFWESKKAFEKKKRHFCSMGCYSLFRTEALPLIEQHAYKGIRKDGESKQVYSKRYNKTHPENIAHLKANRYARERGATGSHTLLQWQMLKLTYCYKCAICAEKKPLTKDHKIPLSKRGSNNIDNIQPLCRNCNSKKNTKLIYENPELL